jgi:hypothetical protein
MLTNDTLLWSSGQRTALSCAPYSLGLVLRVLYTIFSTSRQFTCKLAGCSRMQHYSWLT